MGRGSGLSTAIPWDALLEAQGTVGAEGEIPGHSDLPGVDDCRVWVVWGHQNLSLLPPGSDAHGGGESNGAVSLLEGKEGRGQKPHPQEPPSCPPVPSVLPSAPSVPQQTFHIATAPPHSTPKL